MGVGIGKTGLNASSEAALDLVVGIDGAVSGAIEVVFEGPGGGGAILYAGLGVVICVEGGIGGAVLDAAVVVGIFEGHYGAGGTGYIAYYVLDTHFLVESSA